MSQAKNVYRSTVAAVRRGEISPMDALDVAVSLRVRGFPHVKLEAWADRRVNAVRRRGENPLLRESGGR